MSPYLYPGTLHNISVDEHDADGGTINSKEVMYVCAASGRVVVLN
jgi:hypothetical protein